MLSFGSNVGSTWLQNLKKKSGNRASFLLFFKFSPLFCTVKIMGRIQFLLEIHFFNEIGFVEKIKWILRQFFHVGINTTKYKMIFFLFKISIFTWIVADKTGKLDAEVSSVDQHLWG